MGTLHVVTGADHISAVASLAVGNSPSRAFALGARWGAGHSVGLLFVFVVLLALRLETDEAFMRVASRWMGLCVGAFMVALGVYGVREVDQRLRDAERDGGGEDGRDEERARLFAATKETRALDDDEKRLTLNEKNKTGVPRSSPAGSRSSQAWYTAPPARARSWASSRRWRCATSRWCSGTFADSSAPPSSPWAPSPPAGARGRARSAGEVARASRGVWRCAHPCSAWWSGSRGPRFP